MFNRENKKDIENATNIFRTIAKEMGFRKEPINMVILGWEEWDENVEPSAFGMMARPSIPVNHEGVVMLLITTIFHCMSLIFEESKAV